MTGRGPGGNRSRGRTDPGAAASGPGRRRPAERPPVARAGGCRPRHPRTAGQPADHQTAELDLGGFPPVCPDPRPPTSGTSPAARAVAPRPPRRAVRRPAGCSASTSAPCGSGVALSDPTGTLASPLETLRRAKDQRRSRPARRPRGGTRGDRGGRGGAEAPVGCVGRLGARTPAYAQELADRIGDVPVHPDRRKALHRDRSQSPARRRHRQPPAARGDRPGGRRGHPAAVTSTSQGAHS